MNERPVTGTDIQNVDAETAFREGAAAVGVIGLKPHVDAVKLTDDSATRVLYIRSGAIREVVRTDSARGGMNLEMVGAVDPEQFQDYLADAETVEVVDQRPFNRLVSTIDAVPRSVCWSVVLHFGSFDSIAKASERQLQDVPGVGEAFSRRLVRETYTER